MVNKGDELLAVKLNLGCEKDEPIWQYRKVALYPVLDYLQQRNLSFSCKRTNARCNSMCISIQKLKLQQVRGKTKFVDT
jgi:hypothetical protein